MGMEVSFWGVRGSIAVSGERYTHVGGNTSCVSVLVNETHLVIFDAGSGLYELGQWLATTSLRSVDLVLTHLHLDHVMGLPFFSAIWDPAYTIHLYSERKELKQFLEQILFHSPLFPVNLRDVGSTLKFHPVTLGQPLPLNTDILLNSYVLEHPGGAAGYRLEHEGKSVCYITDVEHDPDSLDTGLIDFIKGTDLFIYDSAYTEEEYQRKRGWGHSTHIRAAELAQAAQVKNLALFHHDPAHDDDIVLKTESEAREIFPATIAARQGLKIEV